MSRDEIYAQIEHYQDIRSHYSPEREPKLWGYWQRKIEELIDELIKRGEYNDTDADANDD